MDYIIGHLARKADFNWWPLHHSFELLAVVITLIIVITYCISGLIQNSRNKAKNKTIKHNNNGLNVTLFTALLIMVVVIIVNGVRVRKNIGLAVEIADNLSLTDDALVVPDYLNSQKKQFLVMDGSKVIATVDQSGYHSAGKQGDALYRLSHKVFKVRENLLSKKAYQQAAANRTIRRKGQSYVASVSPGDNNTYIYSSKFNKKILEIQK